LKTTVLFALFLALLANPPGVRGPGQEQQGKTPQGEEQSSTADPSKAAKSGEPGGKENPPKNQGKNQESVRKD
jgi:hypothetical protein